MYIECLGWNEQFKMFILDSAIPFFVYPTKIFAHRQKAIQHGKEWLESGNELLDKRIWPLYGKLENSVQMRQKCVHWLHRGPSHDIQERGLLCKHCRTWNISPCVCHIDKNHPSFPGETASPVFASLSLCWLLHVIPTPAPYEESALQPSLHSLSAQFRTYNRNVINCFKCMVFSAGNSADLMKKVRTKFLRFIPSICYLKSIVCGVIFS